MKNRKYLLLLPVLALLAMGAMIHEYTLTTAPGDDDLFLIEKGDRTVYQSFRNSDLKQRETNAALGAVAGQVLVYTANPNTEGVTPKNQNQPATCYQSLGAGPFYVWDTSGHTWR